MLLAYAIYGWLVKMNFDTSSNIIFPPFLSIFYAVVTSELIHKSFDLDT